MTDLFDVDEFPYCCGAMCFFNFLTKKDYETPRPKNIYDNWGQWLRSEPGTKPETPYVDQLTADILFELKADKLPCFAFAITTADQEKAGVGEALKAAGFEQTAVGINRIHGTRLHHYMLKRNPVRKRTKK